MLFSQCIFNRRRFLLRTLWLPAVLRLWFVVVLALYDAMLPFHLGNIQVRYMKSVLFLHPLPDLLIALLILRRRQIPLIHIHIDLLADMILSIGRFEQ